MSPKFVDLLKQLTKINGILEALIIDSPLEIHIVISG